MPQRLENGMCLLTRQDVDVLARQTVTVNLGFEISVISHVSMLLCYNSSDPPRINVSVQDPACRMSMRMGS